MKILKALGNKHRAIIQASRKRDYTGLISPDYIACIHYHYDNIKLSIWHRNNKNEESLNLVIINSIVEVESYGEYKNNCREIITLIDAWLDSETP